MGIKREVERQRAIYLRLAGKSYNEIRRALNVRSKGTISYWLKGLILSSSARELLREKIKRAHERGFFKFNKERTNRIQKENRRVFGDGKRAVGTLTQRELLLIGAALYWGEGTKTAAKSGARLSFVNSDALMIALFMRFIREVLRVPESRIRAGMHLYHGTRTENGRHYWAKITGLPPERFYVVRQISKTSRRRRDARLLPYGTFVIRVHDRKLFFHVKGMIEGLSKSRIG